MYGIWGGTEQTANVTRSRTYVRLRTDSGCRHD